MLSALQEKSHTLLQACGVVTWEACHTQQAGRQAASGLDRFFSDLLIGHLQDMAASEIIERHAASENEAATHQHRRLHQHHQGLQTLGAPLQKDNWANLTDTCILEEDFKSMVRPGEVSSTLLNQEIVNKLA